ncbi:hypothetical protein [Limnovirga soli]|uniref:Uncharacterized protein n=1 Tax=Limnovirga soli TaxID=2656915 RepID=A0A8J8FIN5_9BACT|nr:hypothetical protein [Limnovirga soli]NNV58047.1 hypothetical protein [Limnovirga soli]
MKTIPFIVFSIILSLCSEGQIIDMSLKDTMFFRRGDTLFLKTSGIAFNGFIKSDSVFSFYQNGILTVDSPFSSSDNRRFLTELIFPIEKDTFWIDRRNKIDTTAFKVRNIFYLEDIKGKSRIINFDTLQAKFYTEILIPDLDYYKFYQQNKTCPISNHQDNIIPLLYGLPNQEGQRLVKEKRVILKGCFGPGQSDALYYCQKHNIEF